MRLTNVISKTMQSSVLFSSLLFHLSHCGKAMQLKLSLDYARLSSKGATVYLRNTWLEVTNDLAEMNPNLGIYLFTNYTVYMFLQGSRNFFGSAANQLPIAGPEE